VKGLFERATLSDLKFKDLFFTKKNNRQQNLPCLCVFVAKIKLYPKYFSAGIFIATKTLRHGFISMDHKLSTFKLESNKKVTSKRCDFLFEKIIFPLPDY
jgi:hypothetical protein